MNNKKKAVLYMLTSSFFFAVMATFVKLSGELPVYEKIFFRNLISTFVALIVTLKNKKPLFGKRENQKYLMLRTMFGTFGMLGYFYSIDKLILSDSAMINKLNPFFVSIFAYIFLKEKFSKIQIPALVGAFAGALFIIKPQFNMETFPALIGLLAAISGAGAYTTVSFLGKREENYTIVFYFSLFSTLLMIPFLAYNYVALSMNQLIFLVLTGISASIAQFTMTTAYKLAPAGEISILNYTNVLFSGIFGFVLWNNIPDSYSMIGYALIIASAFAIYIYKNKENKNTKKIIS